MVIESKVNGNSISQRLFTQSYISAKMEIFSPQFIFWAESGISVSKMYS